MIINFENNAHKLSQALTKHHSKYRDYNKHIKITYSDIRQIDMVGKLYSALASLTLNHCQLKNLRGIQQFTFLETLEVKYNNITTIVHLKYNKYLQSLNLIGNQICHNKQYFIQSVRSLKLNIKFLNNQSYQNYEKMHYNMFKQNRHQELSDGKNRLSLYKKSVNFSKIIPLQTEQLDTQSLYMLRQNINTMNVNTRTQSLSMKDIDINQLDNEVLKCVQLFRNQNLIKKVMKALRVQKKQEEVNLMDNSFGSNYLIKNQYRTTSGSESLPIAKKTFKKFKEPMIDLDIDMINQTYKEN